MSKKPLPWSVQEDRARREERRGAAAKELRLGGFSRFQCACGAAGLPVPSEEHVFEHKATRLKLSKVRAYFDTIRWRFDYAWISEKVALEVQGGIWRKKGGAHQGKGAMRDVSKFTEAACMGWLILYTVPDELMSGKTFDNIRRALARRALEKTGERRRKMTLRQMLERHIKDLEMEIDSLRDRAQAKELQNYRGHIQLQADRKEYEKRRLEQILKEAEDADK